MITTMTAGERVRATLKGDAVDRVPLCFWHHFRPEGSGERLAAETLTFFQQKFQLDIVKIMPDLPYPALAAPIVEAQQVRSIPHLDMNTPAFREQLLCVRLLRKQLGPDYPLLVTIFSPLTCLFNMLQKQHVIALVREDPASLEVGLNTIATNLRHLLQACLEAGASGIFFSSMGATTADLTMTEYEHFGRPYDLAALAGAQGGWLNTIHIHAEPEQSDDEIYFDLFNDYPVSVMSWSDRVTGPSLSEALTMTDKCLMGGLSERGPLVHGSETELENEIISAIAQTHGRRLILTNGCSIPDDTPEQWLHTARQLIESMH